MQIHGISGWSKDSKKAYALLGEIIDPKNGMAEHIAPGIAKEIRELLSIPEPGAESPLNMADLDTPEKRLAEFKKAAEEGRIELAPSERGGFIVQWSGENGFGELTVCMKEDGKIVIDDECMSRDSLLEILKATLDAGETFSEQREKEKTGGDAAPEA